MAFSFFKTETKPILIAHRGASAYAPENTLAAFKLALDMGVRYIELDVHQTRDGQVVVAHDGNLSRFSKTKKKIHELNFEDLCRYSAGAWFDKRYRGEHIPRLEEVLTLIARRAVVGVDIKGNHGEYPGIEEKVLDILEKRGYNGMSYISTHHIPYLEQVRKLEPTMLIGYHHIGGNVTEGVCIAREMHCDALVVPIGKVTKSLVLKAHQRSLHLCVYTANKKSSWEHLAALHVDAIFTDYPDLLGIPEFEQPTLGLTNGE